MQPNHLPCRKEKRENNSCAHYQAPSGFLHGFNQLLCCCTTKGLFEEKSTGRYNQTRFDLGAEKIRRESGPKTQTKFKEEQVAARQDNLIENKKDYRRGGIIC